MPARKIENRYDEFKDFIESTCRFLVQINTEDNGYLYEFDSLENGIVKFKHYFRVVRNHDIDYDGTIEF